MPTKTNPPYQHSPPRVAMRDVREWWGPSGASPPSWGPGPIVSSCRGPLVGGGGGPRQLGQPCARPSCRRKPAVGGVVAHRSSGSQFSLRIPGATNVMWGWLLQVPTPIQLGALPSPDDTNPLPAFAVPGPVPRNGCGAGSQHDRPWRPAEGFQPAGRIRPIHPHVGLFRPATKLGDRGWPSWRSTRPGPRLFQPRASWPVPLLVGVSHPPPPPPSWFGNNAPAYMLRRRAGRPWTVPCLGPDPFAALDVFRGPGARTRPFDAPKQLTKTSEVRPLLAVGPATFAPRLRARRAVGYPSRTAKSAGSDHVRRSSPYAAMFHYHDPPRRRAHPSPLEEAVRARPGRRTASSSRPSSRRPQRPHLQAHVWRRNSDVGPRATRELVDP